MKEEGLSKEGGGGETGGGKKKDERSWTGDPLSINNQNTTKEHIGRGSKDVKKELRTLSEHPSGFTTKCSKRQLEESRRPPSHLSRYSLLGCPLSNRLKNDINVSRMNFCTDRKKQSLVRDQPGQE